MSDKWKYPRPVWWGESCARRDYERLRSEVDRLRPVADIVDLSNELERLKENERLRDELKDREAKVERLQAEIEQLRQEIKRLINGMESAFSLLANGEISCTNKWQAAFEKWRDQEWHPALDRNISEKEVGDE